MAKDASALREIRARLGLSQAECATALGVAVETFRTWDAGRRPAPEAFVRCTRALNACTPGTSSAAKLYMGCTNVTAKLFVCRESVQLKWVSNGEPKTETLPRAFTLPAKTAVIIHPGDVGYQFGGLRRGVAITTIPADLSPYSGVADREIRPATRPESIHLFGLCSVSDDCVWLLVSRGR
jgi:hypothetical protein